MTPAGPRLRRREIPAFTPWADGTPPVLQRVYAARGVLSPADAELKLARLAAPDALGQADAAAAQLAEAIAADRHILVVGDFDCDGATGTALAVRGLRMLGARRVGYRVPHRIRHGYGLSPALVEDLAPLSPDLLLTVDSGIACHAGVDAARQRGWQVIVTDHHLPGESLPAADAIVNPNLRGDGFPSKALAGVGVVFYLLLALRRQLREAGRLPAPEPDLATLLDLVAVGTVADLVPLDYNNRLLVAAGLRRMREGRLQPGLRALAECAGRPLATLSATDIGFALGPRLNAAGRLEDMAIGIELLLSDDPARAFELARALDAINAERRDLQAQMVEEAEALAARAVHGEGALPDVLCVHDPGWHAGVVGLVASRLKERWHRPALAFARADDADGALLKGSARSIPGLHIRDALAAVDARHPGLIERFGGHAMAAGLSLRAGRLPEFSAALQAVVSAQLSDEQREAELWSDGELDRAEMGRDLAERLRLAGPWGQGFPEPVFDGEFDVLEGRPVGGRHLKLRLQPAAGGPALPGIQFGGWQGAAPSGRVRIAYQLDLDDWNGRRGIQLLVRHLAPAP